MIIKQNKNNFSDVEKSKSYSNFKLNFSKNINTMNTSIKEKDDNYKIKNKSQNHKTTRNYTDFELNTLSYNNALQDDKRTFLFTIYPLLD